MRNDTLNALILRHGDRMLQDAGWPDAVDMAPVAPEIVPGWLAACQGCAAARSSNHSGRHHDRPRLAPALSPQR